MTASGRRAGPAAGPGSPGRSRGELAFYLGTLSDDIVVLDRGRAVVLDLTRARPEPGWREWYASAAAGFAWPAATRIEIGQRGGWHAYLGSGPGCRWSSWSLPEVHEMITRATGAC